MKRYKVSTKRSVAHDFLECWDNFLKTQGRKLYYVITEEDWKDGFYELLLMNHDEAMLYNCKDKVYVWTEHGCERYKRR